MVIDLKNATIKIKDGTTPTANSLTVRLGSGTLSYDESRNVEYILNRGKLDDVRLGDEVPMDVSIDAMWSELRASSGDPPTIEDVLKKRGVASSWVSTDADGCRPYAVDIEVEHTPICNNIDIETILLSDFRYDKISHDPKTGMLKITGKCNVTEASITRTAQV